MIKTNSLKKESTSNSIKIFDISLKFKNPFNVSKKESTKYVARSLSLAHRLSENKQIRGFINCPINKKLISKSSKIGITEYLASKCKIRDNSEVMLIYNKKLSVVPATTHLDIKNVHKKLQLILSLEK